MAYTTINKSTDYFNTKLYTGNGGTNAQTGVGFQPDLTWIKCRDDTHNPNWFDAVRGVTKRISSHSTAAESTVATSLTSFDNDGFTLGSDGGQNFNSNTYASWNWKANGAGSANTDGSINTTTTSANTTAGFSISKYTGTGASATIGHGLGVAPNIIITKQLTGTQQWNFQSSMMGYSQYMSLNTTDASQGTSGALISSVNSTTYSCDGNSVINASGQTYIAYCFAEKTGYSKFGSYVGNGNADGTFVYTGFKPAWIMIKRTDGADTWTMYDNKRAGFNVDNNPLFANASTTESTDDDLDILSNGFKIRRNSGRINTSGATNIYMAFAEAPLVGTNGVTAKAR